MIARKIIAVVVLISAVCYGVERNCSLRGRTWGQGHIPLEDPCFYCSCLPNGDSFCAIEYCPYDKHGSFCADGSCPKYTPDDCCRVCDNGKEPMFAVSKGYVKHLAKCVALHM